MLALLWSFLLTGGLWSWAACPSMEQACDRECEGSPFPGRRLVPAGELGLKEPPHPLIAATESISTPHPQHPAPFTSGWVKSLLPPHVLATPRHLPESQKGLDVGPGMILIWSG